MIFFRRRALQVILVGALALVPLTSARADVIQSGGYAVGVDPTGTLYTVDPTLGPVGFLRLSDGLDVITPGTPRDTYGVSAGNVSGFADPQVTGGGGSNGGSIVNGSATFTPTTAQVQSFLKGSSGNLLQVDQRFFFAASNVLQIQTTLTNVSGVGQSIQFRRFVDFDVASASSSAFRNIDKASPLIGAVNQGSFGGSTTSSSGPLQEKADPLVPFLFPTPGGGGTLGAPGFANSFDLGAGINVNLGLLPGIDDPLTPQDERVTKFNFFYGLNIPGQSEDQLRQELALLGANYTITTRSSNATGAINTAALGVQVGTPIPEPGTLALLGIGMTGLLAYRRRRNC